MTQAYKMWIEPGFVSEFIDKYKSYPCLWQVKCPDYMNKIKKEAAYKDLLEFCRRSDPGVSIEFVKTKINNLRSSFRKELKKVHKSRKFGAESGDIYVPKLWYFSLLGFLYDQESPRSSRSYVDEELEDQHETAESMSPNPTLMLEVVTEEDQEKQESSSGEEGPPAEKRRKRQSKFSEAQADAYRTSLLLRAEQLLNSEKHRDEFDSLGDIVARKLRKMNLQQQIFAENVINRALFFGSMGQLTASSDVHPIGAQHVH